MDQRASTVTTEPDEGYVVIEKEYDPNSSDRICCVELPNNNLVYIRYEEGWTIKDLIIAVLEHKEFQKLYQNRKIILSAKSQLFLYDLLIAFYRNIKPENEIRIDYDLELDYFHREGLLKNHKHRLFIFTDNRIQSNILYKNTKVINESLKKVREHKDNNYIYTYYLPRINTNNFFDNHPEIIEYFQNNKHSLNSIKRFYLNPLISDKNETFDWFIYDDESFSFLIEMQKCKINILSNIKLINNKIYFEDVCESYKLTDDDLDKCFVNVTLDALNDNITGISKKIKINIKTTGYDLLETMNKKLEGMRSQLVFKTQNKILKVRSLNDYVFNLKIPLINFTYLNECLKSNKEPEYYIIDNPLLKENNVQYTIQESLNNKEFINNYKNENKNKQTDFYFRNHYEDLMNVATYNSSSTEENNDIKYDNLIKNEESKEDDLFDFVNDIVNEINKESSFFKSDETKTLKYNSNYVDNSNIISDKLFKETINSVTKNFNISTFLDNKRKINTRNNKNIFKEESKNLININEKLNKLYQQINIKNIKKPFTIILKNAKLDQVYNSFPAEKGSVLLFRVQIMCGYQEFSKSRQIKWKSKTNDLFPLFNKRINFEVDYNSLPNFASILFRVKFIQYDKSNEIIDGKSLGWANFRLFDNNKKLKSGLHKISLFKRNFGEDSYFTYTDSDEDDSIDIYFEVDSFCKSVDNKDIKIINYNKNNKIHQTFDQSYKNKITQIIKKNPFDDINNIEKDILWTNRFSSQIMNNIISRLVQSFDYNNPRNLIELEKVFNLIPNLPVVQSLELINGNYLNSSIRNFAVKCLKKASNFALENYLLQMVQGLKYEMYHDSELARFLIDIGVKYPLTIGHSLFWLFRSEMYNQNVQQRFGIYLEIFLNKIGPVIGDVFKDEDFLVRNLLKIAEIPKSNLKKPEKDQLFKEALDKFNQEITKNKKIISIPLNFKYRVIGLNLDKCKYMKSKKKPMWLAFKSEDTFGKELAVMFKKGDDLRMDTITMQLFKAMQTMWFERKIKLKMSLYGIMSTGLNHGILEMVTESVTLAEIHKQEGGAIQTLFSKSSIKNWLNDNSYSEKEYTENFLLSSVAYCVATFVLGIGDRHNDNIMIKKNGEIFHIDFGHFLGHFKYKMGIKRERAPFVFTKQFLNVLGDENGVAYKKFKELLESSYQILRDNCHSLVTLLRILLVTGIPELDDKSIRFLEYSLALKSSKEQAKVFLENALNDAINSVSTKFNFAIHIVANK